MKKIIRKGHKYREATCSYCDCFFQYEDEDIEESKPVYNNDGVEWGKDIKIECPYCAKKFTTRI